MLRVIKEALIPLISLFLFVLGTGFFATLLTLKMTVLKVSPIVIGSLTGFFYAGLILGSFRIEKYIVSIGHIRAYAGFSAMLAIFCLLHGVYYNPWFWLALRFGAGFATAGIYVVIESWLLCKSAPSNRGQVLSLYMIVLFAAQSMGQFIVTIESSQSMLLYAIASMLCSLSIIPLTISQVQTPIYEEPSSLSFKKIIKKSASGMLGCLSSGLIMGGIYGLMPAYFIAVFQNNNAVAKYMFAVIFGGMLLQYPVGKLSDIIERRLVLVLVCIATVIVSILAIFLSEYPRVLFVLMMFFGGLTFTMYPVSISYACDSLENKDIISGTQSLLLTYSIGAMLGPFISPLFMKIFGTYGLFLFFIFVCTTVIPIFLWRRTQKPDVPRDDPFMSIPQTSPIISQIDPRG